MALRSFAFGSNPFPTSYEVLKVYTLQCTDMAGGNNKHYLGELQKASDGTYRIYTAYGRTGASYVAQEERFPDAYSAEREFESLIKSKIKKGYREVKVATAAHASEVGKTQILSQDIAATAPTKQPNTTVLTDPRVIPLIERLYAEAGQGCQSRLHGSLKTSADNPLGVLTIGQINTGRSVLDEINKWLVANPTEVGKLHRNIISWTNDFYSAIPQQIPLRPKEAAGRETWLQQYCLNRPSILDEKYDLLDLLGKVDDMKIAFHSTDIDKKYAEANCEFRVASAANVAYARKYMEESQSKHHHWRLQAVSVWEIASNAQKNNLTFMNQVGNIQKLFHGTGPQNILGICRKGFLLKPPGVYISGKMFGEGTYFADQSTKSSQYATGRFGGYTSKYSDTSFMYIADVALGRVKEYDTGQWSLVRPPNGYDSVKGVKGVSLLHNEYIVYSEKQNQLALLIEFKQKYT